MWGRHVLNLQVYRISPRQFRHLIQPSPSSTISRAPLPISFTAYHAVDVACFILEKLADVWGLGLANIVVLFVRMLATHFNSGTHVVSDAKIRTVCSTSDSKDSRKSNEMRLISKLGTLHPLGMNERFSYILYNLSLTNFLRHGQVLPLILLLLLIQGVSKKLKKSEIARKLWKAAAIMKFFIQIYYFGIYDVE